MKRLHVHVSVESLDKAVGFYSTLFAAKPSVLRPDYAKWMLDDPCVNFAISTRGRTPGIDHLGIQAEDAAELAEIYARLRKAEAPVVEQGATTCCYAKSEKSWVTDPQGISWEAFLTHGESTVYGDSIEDGKTRAKSACCEGPSMGAMRSSANAKTACCGPDAS
jgi:hypothetical protein